MRRSLATFLLLLPLCILASAPSRGQEQWFEVAPPGEGYRIEFPSRPQESRGEAPTPFGSLRLSIARLEAPGDFVYLATATTFPSVAMPKDPQRALDEARNKNVRDLKGEMRTEQRLVVSKAPARRIVIDVRDKKQVNVALLVMSGHRLYQASVTVPLGQERSPSIDHFLKSLILIEASNVTNSSR